MTLDDALQRLFNRNLHLIKLDLTPMRVLMEIMGHPERSLVCLHVAGTNGKGSVCAMLSSILRKQGYKTGLYTSPHLVRFNERIRINENMIPDDDLTALIAEVEQAAAQLPGRGLRDVTFFEFTTALAFLYFKKSGVQVAVIETGMGGRLDATNIITPAVSVITSIGLEHTAYLGDTIEKIAVEKAGIIKPGRPVVVGNVPDEAMAVIARRADDQKAPLRRTPQLIGVSVKSIALDGQTLSISSESMRYESIRTTLSGEHQAANAAIAVATAECLDQEVGLPVSAEAIQSGLASTRWPARCQVIGVDPPVILDGAHNPDAARVLARWIKKVAPKRPVGMVVGFLTDKNPELFMREFSAVVKHVWIVPIHSQRAMPVDDVARRLSFLKHTVICRDVNEAKAAAAAWASTENGIVVVTGSLYLAGEVLAPAI